MLIDRQQQLELTNAVREQLGIHQIVRRAPALRLFQVAIIPHTWDVTTLRELQPGSRVNLEIDMLARYVARMIGVDAPSPHDAEGAKDG